MKLLLLILPFTFSLLASANAFVGQITLNDSQQSSPHCLGTLIAPRLILTAKHCLPWTNNETFDSSVSVTFARNGGVSALIVDAISGLGDWDENLSSDWAIATLKTSPISLSVEYPRVVGHSELASTSVSAVGKTFDLLGVDSNHVLYLGVSVSPGDSGSPLVGKLKNGKMGIVGIVTRESLKPFSVLRNDTGERQVFDKFSYGVSCEAFIAKLHALLPRTK